MGTTEVVALIGVLGTLIGTLGGAILNYVLSKWKEDESRRQDTKQQVYEEYAAMALLPNRFFDLDKHPEQHARVYAKMDLYGASEVRLAAKQMFNLETSRVDKPEDSEEYKQLTEAMESARSDFIKAVRDELGYSHE